MIYVLNLFEKNPVESLIIHLRFVIWFISKSFIVILCSCMVITHWFYIFCRNFYLFIWFSHISQRPIQRNRSQTPKLILVINRTLVSISSIVKPIPISIPLTHRTIYRTRKHPHRVRPKNNKKEFQAININNVHLYHFSLSSPHQAKMEVEDLFTDLADGIKLLKLLEIISGEKLGKPNNGRMRVHKIENVNKSLAFLHTKVSSTLSSPVFIRIYCSCKTSSE